MLEPTPPYGGNAEFLDSLYEQYLRDPASVELQWRQYFDRLAPPGGRERAHGPIRSSLAERARAPRVGTIAAAPQEAGGGASQAAVSRLIQIWTNRGHLIAKLDPLELTERPRPSVLDLAYFGLTEADLDSE